MAPKVFPSKRTSTVRIGSVIKAKVAFIFYRPLRLQSPISAFKLAKLSGYGGANLDNIVLSLFSIPKDRMVDQMVYPGLKWALHQTKYRQIIQGEQESDYIFERDYLERMVVEMLAA